jgi:hypothetical protein
MTPEQDQEAAGFRPNDMDETRVFRERMSWKPGDVTVLTAEEAAKRIGRSREDMSDVTNPSQQPRTPLQSRPRIREAEDLASDSKLSLEEKFRRIEQLATEEEAEAYPDEPVLVWKETAAMLADFDEMGQGKKAQTESPEAPS